MKKNFKKLIILMVLLIALNITLFISISNVNIFASDSVYQIIFDTNLEDNSINLELVGYDKAYSKYGDKSIYATYTQDGFLLEECAIPKCVLTKNGCEITFEGWCNIDGVQIVRFDGEKCSTIPLKSGYTNLSGEWILTSNIVLYPKYSVTVLPSRVNFVTNLSQVQITGRTSLYISYGNAEFCLDEDCTEFVQTLMFPTAIKAQLGYTYEFLGWYTSENEESAVKIIDSNNNLVQAVNGYTDKYGNWAYIGDIALYPLFKTNEISVQITLTTQDEMVQIIGTNQVIYARYMNENLYQDRNFINLADNLPTATKTIYGYDSVFIGWYSIEDKCIIDTQGKLQKSVSGYTNEKGEWTLTTACQLYAKFDDIPHTVTINFVTNDKDIQIVGVNKVYSKYNHNLFYVNQDFLAMATIPQATKVKIGYKMEFLGWEINGIVLINKNGILQSDIENITNKQGMFIIEGEITLSAKILESPYTLCVKFDANFENGIVNGKNELFISYDDNKFYLEEEKINLVNIPSAIKNLAGYQTEFLGWYDSVTENATQCITVDNQFNECSIFKNGKFVSLTQVTLYAKFKQTPLIYYIKLEAGVSNLEINQVFINYDDNVFYKDIDCQIQITIPIPTKEQEGYDIVFDGYYLTPEYDTLVINKQGFLQAGVNNITNSHGLWNCTENITLYAKFNLEKKVYEIELTATEGKIEGDYNKLYVKYHSNIFYNSKDCLTVFESIPMATLNKGGYTVTFMGYYTMPNGGIQIINENLKLLSNVENYTDQNSNWLPIEKITLYAQFNLEKCKYMLEFLNKDNENEEITIQGNQVFYVEFESKEFYLDNELTQLSNEFPVATKEHIGYDYQFKGWYVLDNNNYIKIIDHLGSLVKVLGYTCYSEQGDFAYCKTSNISLIPYFEKQGKIFSLNFEVENQDGTLIGNNTYYCIYGDDKLYSDIECKNIVELSDYPRATKEIVGHNVQMLGWFTSNDEMVFDNSLNIQQNATNVVSDYKWQFTQQTTLYVKFNISPQMYIITLNAVQNGGYIFVNQTQKDEINLYIEYNDNVLYTDTNKTNTAYIVNATKNVVGYNSQFIGWKDLNDNLVLEKDQSNFGILNNGYTDENGNWIYLTDVKLVAVFDDEPVINKIELVGIDCIIENNISSIYCRYDDTKIYSDKLCQNEIQSFPSATKTQKGYRYTFRGWFDVLETGDIVVDNNMSIVNFTSVYSDGWKITKTLTLYPLFNQKANIYQITFDNSHENQEEKVIGYIAYNTSKIYSNEALTDPMEVLQPTYNIKGYTTTLKGWYLDSNEDSQMLINKHLDLQQVENYVDINNNYILDNNLTVFSKYELTPNVYKLTLNSQEGKIENTEQNSIELYIIYDTNEFYTNITCQEEFKTLIPSSTYNLKGYTISFDGYYYQDSLLIDKNGILQNKYGYIENGLWNINFDIELNAKYTITANIYSVIFDPNSNKGGSLIGEVSTLYIEYNSNKFYLDNELQNLSQIPLSKCQNESILFSGYYTLEGVWLIDENLNFIINNSTQGLLSKNEQEEVCWNIDYNITLYADYKGIEDIFEINLIVDQNDYSENFENRTIFVEYDTDGMYLDKFKNLKVNNETNKLSLENIDSEHYDFKFYGYYTQPNGQGMLIINENNSFVNENVENYLLNGKWVGSNSNLYAYYTCKPKTFKLTFDTIKNGGELQTTQNEYFVTYSQSGIYDKNNNKIKIPTAIKRLEGYKCTFIGYKNSQDVLVIEYNNEECQIINNISGITDQQGNWLIGNDLVLYACFEEEIVTYDAIFYNYDGSIFEIIDLNYGDKIIVPQNEPVKVIEDSNKEFVFRFWDTYNYNKNTIMIETKHYYPVFEEFDKKVVQDNQTQINCIQNNKVQIYVKDLNTQNSLLIKFEELTITLTAEDVDKLVQTCQGLGDYLSLEINELQPNSFSNGIIKYTENQKIFSIVCKIGKTSIIMKNASNTIQQSFDDLNLSNTKTILKIQYKQLSPNLPIKAYIINEKLNTKNEINNDFNQEENYIIVTLKSLNSITLMIANYDSISKQAFTKNLIKIVIIAVASIIGGGLLVVIIIFTIKACKKKSNKKTNETKSTPVNEQPTKNIASNNREFLNSLSKNSLNKNNNLTRRLGENNTNLTNQNNKNTNDK